MFHWCRSVAELEKWLKGVVLQIYLIPSSPGEGRPENNALRKFLLYNGYLGRVVGLLEHDHEGVQRAALSVLTAMVNKELFLNELVDELGRGRVWEHQIARGKLAILFSLLSLVEKPRFDHFREKIGKRLIPQLSEVLLGGKGDMEGMATALKALIWGRSRNAELVTVPVLKAMLEVSKNPAAQERLRVLYTEIAAHMAQWYELGALFRNACAEDAFQTIINSQPSLFLRAVAEMGLRSLQDPSNLEARKREKVAMESLGSL